MNFLSLEAWLNTTYLVLRLLDGKVLYKGTWEAALQDNLLGVLLGTSSRRDFYFRSLRTIYCFQNADCGIFHSYTKEQCSLRSRSHFYFQAIRFSTHQSASKKIYCFENNRSLERRARTT